MMRFYLLKQYKYEDLYKQERNQPVHEHSNKIPEKPMMIVYKIPAWDSWSIVCDKIDTLETHWIKNVFEKML